MFQIKLSKRVPFTVRDQGVDHQLTATVERISANAYFQVIAAQASLAGTSSAESFLATVNMVAQLVSNVEGIDVEWPADVPARVEIINQAGLSFATSLCEAVTSSFSEVSEGNAD